MDDCQAGPAISALYSLMKDLTIRQRATEVLLRKYPVFTGGQWDKAVAEASRLISVNAPPVDSWDTLADCLKLLQRL
jgi:hypothetical protein